MSTKTTKSVSIVLGAAFAVTLAASNIANAAEAGANPFAMTNLEGGYQVAAEGKCGGDKKMTKDMEGKCGEGKETTKAKKEGKCGEGKCGGNKAKPMEGKCGGDKKAMPMEGKCGGDKANKPMEGKCGGK